MRSEPTLVTTCGIIRQSALWALCRYRHKAHWTKHPTRLDRSFSRKAWGDEGYAREELVAELASAFLSRSWHHAGSHARPRILHRKLAYRS